jgi:diguanylate cyclase (GGDEF)-like protein
MRDAAGEVDGTVIALRDVSDLRGPDARDVVPGEPRRAHRPRQPPRVRARLEEALEATHGGARHVLCYLDLDRFKAVNDECGHVAGDNMLREIAALIKEAVRDSDTVGRLGGDEFGILLAGCPLEKARQIADDVVRAVNDHRFIWKDKIFTVGVSVGLVEMTSESTSIEDLLHAADSACYVAKNQGSRVHVYSARDEAAARQRWRDSLAATAAVGPQGKPVRTATRSRSCTWGRHRAAWRARPRDPAALERTSRACTSRRPISCVPRNAIA